MKYFMILILLLGAIFSKAEVPSDSIYNAASEWTDQNGKIFRLTDFQGQYVIVSMVYMKCKSACPLTVARMKEVEKGLPENLRSKVQFLLISFDFKGDTPDVMLSYATKNHLDLARWKFLVGKSESQVREFSTLIDFKYKALPEGEFDHSYAMVALDTEGRILGRTDGAAMNPSAIVDHIVKSATPSTNAKQAL